MTTLNITFESKAVKNYDNNYYRKYEKYTPLSLYNIDNQKITYNPTEYEKYTLLHIYFTFNGESIRKM